MFGVVLAASVLFAEPHPVPAVSNLVCDVRQAVALGAGTEVAVCCPDGQAVAWTSSHLAQWFGVKPRVMPVAGAPERVLDEEGYRLTADARGLRIEARTLQGVRYALYTLRQVAERDSRGETVEGWRLPALTVDDSPAMRFRGLHLCWFPEMSSDLVERQIRLAAAYKFNHVVLESWGVWRSERHPWFGWKDGPMTREAIRRLVDVARDLGVTLVPQLNVFGHATASRSCTGKHATLDFRPERQSLFEPSGDTGAGWNWCLSNPAALAAIRDMVVELHEAFGSPPYFHIGCDEADAPTCASCRAAEYDRLVAGHLAGIAALLKARGARPMMWHDMLLKRGDPRWKGFYANGSEATARLAEMLPKETVVCDWYYGSDPGGTKDEKSRTSVTGSYPTLDYFSNTCGFDTVTCPWEEPNGIRAQGRYAREHGLFGLLATVWHHFGGERFPKIVQMSSCAAWGHGETTGFGRFSAVWRQCGWDAGSSSYRETGWFDNQVSREILGR